MTKAGTVAEYVEEATTEEDPTIRKLRQEVTKLRRQVADFKAGGAIVVDAVSEAIERSPFRIEIPPVPKITKKRGGALTPCLHLSDVQWGKTTATYSSEIAAERVKRAAKKTVELVELRRSTSQIDEIRIYMGGDMVEGENIFPGQAHEIDASVYEQAVVSAPEAFAWAIDLFLATFKKVRVVCVVGNHGRAGRKGDGIHPLSNWDRVFYAALERWFFNKFTPKGLDKRLEFEIADRFAVVDRVYSWGNLITHGDTIRGALGFPWYGASRRVQGWTDSIEDPFDYVFIGHFHTLASYVLNNKMVMANGTPESGNEYALSQLAAKGSPVQRLVFFNEKHGIVSDETLYLDDGERCSQLTRAIRWASLFGGMVPEGRRHERRGHRRDAG